ncbi:MAG: hypothetical protein IJ131_00525 [Eggerthellaceae bacterium]|nr:hypothetical protein [Eggerthellaceae bacterium]
MLPWASARAADMSQEAPVETVRVRMSEERGSAAGNGIVEGLFGKVAGLPAAGELPGDFEGEVVDFSAFSDAEVLASQGVVGARIHGTEQEVIRAVKDQLVTKGWVPLSASEVGSSFVKAEGSYRWANVLAGQNGLYTRMVIMYEKAA